MNGPTLFLIPTPIGNLRDITLRSLDALKQVDLIACEDTRHTRKLLSAYEIHKPTISYEKFNELKKADRIIAELETGKDVALVSDAGTPLISDPGSVLVTKVREKGFRVEALPGPCAAVTALSASGFEGSFRFIGFFPRQKSIAEREVMRMEVSQDNTVFYESPHRILATLSLLGNSLVDRTICLAREISKIHEEYVIGTACEIAGKLEAREAIGEVTVIVQGAQIDDEMDEEAIRERARDLRSAGRTKKDILRALTEETGMGRNKIYDILLSLD